MAAFERPMTVLQPTSRLVGCTDGALSSGPEPLRRDTGCVRPAAHGRHRPLGTAVHLLLDGTAQRLIDPGCRYATCTPFQKAK